MCKHKLLNIRGYFADVVVVLALFGEGEFGLEDPGFEDGGVHGEMVSQGPGFFKFFLNSNELPSS